MYTGTGGLMGPSGTSIQIAGAISQVDTNTLDFQRLGAVNRGRQTTSTIRLVLNGSSSLTATATCPTPSQAQSVGYTVISTGFQLFNTLLSSIEEYTLQH